MRRLTLWFGSTVAVLVLLFSYRTSTMGPAGPGPAVAAPAPGGRSVDGPVVTTRFGPVQVRITVAGGRITDVAAVQRPTGNPRSDQINGAALPLLRAGALSAQSADVDTVSGATYSSAAYRESLQAAIDRAVL